MPVAPTVSSCGATAAPPAPVEAPPPPAAPEGVPGALAPALPVT